jgi:hypothetical protein
MRADMSEERYLTKMRQLNRDKAYMARLNDLLARIKKHLPALQGRAEMMKEVEEDFVYRFYHQSFKVFHGQNVLKKAVALIEQIGGETDPPHDWFMRIVNEGTAHDFGPTTNENWLAETRPILEAFWHTKYFIEMMVKYGTELEEAPQCMPSGWAAVLWLFELR